MAQYTEKIPTTSMMNILNADGADTILYAGTVPFVWSFDCYLQQLKTDTKSRWFVTLHLTAQGSQTVIFKSKTVEVYANELVPVPFPDSQDELFFNSDYYMESCSMSDIEDSGINCIYVQLIPPVTGHAPSIVIVDTKVQPSWIIGAREIVLTDPPLITHKRELVVEESIG